MNICHVGGAIYLDGQRLSLDEACELADHLEIVQGRGLSALDALAANCAIVECLSWRRAAGYEPPERFDEIGEFRGAIREWAKP